MITLLRPFAVVLVAGLGWASVGFARDEPKDKDEALDGLLKTLEDRPSPEDKAGAAAEGAKPADRKPSGEVAPKDQALDNLLEKLGETQETPAPKGRPAGPGEAPMPPQPPDPDRQKAGELTGKAKDLDEHLEELTGRRRKKQDQEQDGEGGGPLSQIIKEMRDVEQRLGKPDTGEETRQKQKQIVKGLDQIIEQIKNSPGQGSGMRRLTMTKQAGQKPGGKQGGPGAQGNTAGGVGPQKPEKPKGKSILADDGRAEWGHLPPELRGEMANVNKEEALPARADLIRRYYLSVSKRGQSREE